MPGIHGPGSGAQVDSRNVLDTNAKTARGFRGQVVGRYQRTGPDRWDPFELVLEDGPTVDLHAGVEIQVEELGVRFRRRSEGEVQVIEWRPEDGEVEDAKDSAALRARFLETCVKPFEHKAGMGAAAFIAKTLTEGGEPEPTG